MLTYTFSRREKVLILALAIILIIFAWYQFVYVNVQNQISTLSQQIAEVQDAQVIDAAKIQKMNSMQKAIDQYKAEGLAKTTMPAYDNQQNVMNELNGLLATTTNYSLTFDALDTGTTGFVKRGVTLVFGCGSYADAELILTNLSTGVYPCSIDSMNIVDNTASTSTSATSYSVVGSGSTTSTASVSVSAHATFTEKGTA